jgi:hypothetical protein
VSEADRAADHTEDPRGQGTAQGYPETGPKEQTPVKGTQEGPTGDAADPVPRTRIDGDSGPGTATGNPDAAGA